MSRTRGMQAALQPLAKVLADVRPSEVDALEKALLGARRIFVTGLGRTGLMQFPLNVVELPKAINRNGLGLIASLDLH